MMPFETIRSRGNNDFTRLKSLSGLVTTVATKDLLRILNVHGIVRVHDLEFPQEIKPGEKVGHFNLPIGPQTIKHMQKDIMLPIVEPGKVMGNETLPPLLSLHAIYMVETIRFIASMPIKEVGRHELQNNIGNIGSHDDLVQIIQRRYAASMGYTEGDVLGQGVAYRLFNVVEKPDPQVVDQKLMSLWQ